MLYLVTTYTATDLFLFFFVGSLICLYGVLLIIDPIKYCLNTLNDAVQRKVYGDKLYKILARYLGGPLTILMGGALIWPAIQFLLE